MPRGIANLFSTLPCMDLFKEMMSSFNAKGIKLELPNTNKVQVWTSEGEMIQIEKRELLEESLNIGDYLIQFWWPQKDDVSIKLVREGRQCTCDIYLDGLNENQYRDILDLLISVTLHNFETVGFVIDGKERTSEIKWSEFFASKNYLGNHNLEPCGLKIYKEYELKDGDLKKLISFKREDVYVAIPNREKSSLTVYLLR